MMQANVMTRVRRLDGTTADAVCEEAAAVARAGGMLAMPTDSFYGLGVNPFDAAAVRRLCAVKGRDEGKPILVLIADRAQLKDLVGPLPAAATALMDRFWPGPLTIVCPAAPALPEVLTAGTGTIGVRLAAQPLLAKLLRHAGPLTGTSANRSGDAPARTAREVERVFGGDVELILDGGPSIATTPSTVVDATGRSVRLVREGPVTWTAIQNVLGREA
jgi:L-threonylcarbamoyladenylate synthase